MRTRAWLVAILVAIRSSCAQADLGLANAFKDPPASARPWVFAYWMDGNITPEGITADLQAMKEQGLGGFTFFDGGLGNPPGPHRFMSDSWQKLFLHLLQETARLGLEVNVNNAPGWSGSGGPWITPEIAGKHVVVSETLVQGPQRIEATLPQPKGVSRGFYRDIAVLAYPISGNPITNRLSNFDSTKAFSGKRDFAGVVPWPRFIPTHPDWPSVANDQCVESKRMKDVSNRMSEDGKLVWEVPEGQWLVLRIGQTVADGETRAAQPDALGLECDKLNRTAVRAHFQSMIGKLRREAGAIGKAWVAAHIDSWEAGSSNWTEGLREEFRRRRGYDLLPYLATLNGLVVDTVEISERFLWDFRETICELVLENYAQYMRELAHEQGMRLTIEAYDGTCDDLRYAGRADEPMGEFWQRPIYNGLPLADLAEEMAFAGHVYGKNIVGAEAFTTARENFLDHPGTLKPLADWAFCTGINRICFSEWVMQPWPRIRPGVMFGEFGTAFHRSLTWWAMAKPWHDYIARCQFLLRQGDFVADVCFLAPEGAPGRFITPIPAARHGGIPDRPGYNYDGCPAELILNPKTTVKDGRLVLPSGMSYSLLVLPSYNAAGEPVIHLLEGEDYFYKASPLPKVETMTPALIKKLRELVQDGAIILGTRPRKSPSLSGFPQCDADVERVAQDLWGPGAGFTGSGERRLGKGRVVWGRSPEPVLTSLNIPQDLEAEGPLRERINYTHRRTQDGSDIYFVVNTASKAIEGTLAFRSTNQTVEYWAPGEGKIIPARISSLKGGIRRVPVSLAANESIFVVFRPGASKTEPLVSAKLNEHKLWPQSEGKSEAETFDDSFILAAWVKPMVDLQFAAKSDIELPQAVPGGWAYSSGQRMAPGFGYQTFTTTGTGRRGFAAGRNGVVFFQYGAEGEVQPLLTYAVPINRLTHVAVTYTNRIPRLLLDGKLVMTGPPNRFPDRIETNMKDRRAFAGDLAALDRLRDLQRENGGTRAVNDRKMGARPTVDYSEALIWQSGDYRFVQESGTETRVTLKNAQPKEIKGPWEVCFEPEWGGPARVVFDKLENWASRPEEGIRHYSGTAIYRKKFHAPFGRNERGTRIFLDLGEVAVMAQVILNSKELGTLWTPPFRVEVTEQLKFEGENDLEIQVVNLWANRMIGDARLGQDGDRDNAGKLKTWPEWVKQGRPNPMGRYTLGAWKVWDKDDALTTSGLLGPVVLRTATAIPPK